MKISRERLLSEAEATGFRPEMLEKVIYLLNLLDGFNKHPSLKGRLALKGGTGGMVRIVGQEALTAEALPYHNRLLKSSPITGSVPGRPESIEKRSGVEALMRR